ncbi:hypothetical protein LTR56_018966 [Elasticomyces elasticus]|nr:hypothetical protein LTR56_018966 [Elasticomyces elasticus]KAK3635566.1 hypothetical protein LTR22_019134 [Elasticomyces elasticus]KAK4911731.1 hypothetical protein LTR49_019721 [Elasticomyces elasticus]KAK5769769.1 hypothetical protein LTS12_000219 [Elasticomyces elasticus]
MESAATRDPPAHKHHLMVVLGADNSYPAENPGALSNEPFPTILSDDISPALLAFKKPTWEKWLRTRALGGLLTVVEARRAVRPPGIHAEDPQASGVTAAFARYAAQGQTCECILKMRNKPSCTRQDEHGDLAAIASLQEIGTPSKPSKLNIP